MRNTELLKKWIIAVRRKTWKPTNASFLCSKHFTPECFYDSPSQFVQVNGQRRKLKPNSVPSLFDFPKHLQNNKKKRRSPVKRTNPGFVPEQNSPAPAKKVPWLDHAYTASLSKENKKLRQAVAKKNRKIRQLRRKNIRLAKKVDNLLSNLKMLQLISQEGENCISSHFGELTLSIIENERKNSGASSGSRYTEEIKQFAISLHYYSPKAYMFVRKALHLPHPSTLRAWSSNVECEPGFLANVLESLSEKAKDAGNDCVLLLDEIAIKKETVWDEKKKKFAGTCDYGFMKAEEPDSAAQNALFLMAVGMKKPWSYPIGYFLTNRMSSDVLTQIVLNGINLLTEAGMEVHAVTFDGCAKNLACAKKLGCDLNKFDGSFPHPSRPDHKIYIVLDICHMIKLARNAFGDMGVFKDQNGHLIEWSYISKLHEVQKKDILCLGNKIKMQHVRWQNHKMKVKVAAQTLSFSVAAAISYLRGLKLPKFKDSKPTTDFIEIMNNLFDVFNSKSKFGKVMKAPLTPENFEDTKDYVNNSIRYLKTLTDAAGKKIIDGPRKTFLIGFGTSAQSIFAIAERLMYRNNSAFEYVLTYKFSQDPLEMFFSKIRSRNGWNNNPNPLQLKWALRALLLKNSIEAPKTANCVI